MDSLYFKLELVDLSQAVLDLSSTTNPYDLKRQGSQVLIKFEYDKVPAELFVKGYSPVAHEAILAEIADGNWGEVS